MMVRPAIPFWMALVCRTMSIPRSSYQSAVRADAVAGRPDTVTGPVVGFGYTEMALVPSKVTVAMLE